MDASLSRLVRVLGQPTPPNQITQQAFDYNTEHYQRLCRLGEAMPSSSDLYRYAEDMRYMPLQPDLLRYLLPICLSAWRTELLSGGHSEYGGFSEQFWTTLSPRSEAQGTLVLEKELTANENKSVMQFMQEALLERMTQEKQLHFVGSGASSYQWFYALGSFCTVFPSLHTLWASWWQMKTPGHAVCVLQYISCLMYEDNKNPIFAPWTPDKGGGPPQIWESEGFAYDYGWRQENVVFLASITTKYILEKLKEAAANLGHQPDEAAPYRMLVDWPKCYEVAASRVAELPQLVVQAHSTYPQWTT